MAVANCCGDGEITISTSWVLRGLPWAPAATDPTTMYGIPTDSISATTHCRNSSSSVTVSPLEPEIQSETIPPLIATEQLPSEPGRQYILDCAGEYLLQRYPRLVVLDRMPVAIDRQCPNDE